MKSSRFLGMAALLCLLPVRASANHLHYVGLSDSRYTGQLLADILPDPDAPLHDLIAYEGDDEFTSYSNAGRTVHASSGQGLVSVLIDAPAFADITNTRATAFSEFEVSELDTSGSQSMLIGLTDLVNLLRWDETEGRLRADRSGLDSADVTGLPRWSTIGALPLRIQMYYQFNDKVMTYVVIDDALGTSTRVSWQAPATKNPFQDFFGQVGGTDPDNLDIYPYVLCQAPCTVTALRSGIVNCDSAGGAVDVDNCRPLVGNGVVDPGETCDDGNVLPGDGCDENGQLERIGRKCQEAIGRAGQKYVMDRLKSLQKCRNLLNAGATLFQDQARTLAITDRSGCPNEFKTARNLARARERVRKLVAARCTDTLVGALGTCGETVDELVSPDGTAGCLIETHDAGVAALLTAEYGG